MARPPCWLAAVVCSLAAAPAWGEAGSAGSPSPVAALSAQARLDFIVNIGKFLFFRVGTGSYPSASGTVETVTFNLVPSIPPAPTLPAADGSGLGVPWDGTPPTFTTGASGNVLPVEVRSNAGQVSLRATVTAALVSGGNNLPFSEVVVTSSDANLPAPPIPDSGTGATVDVAGTAFASRVTVRSAIWTFSYAPTSPPVAGSYSGQVSFTAAVP